MKIFKPLRFPYGSKIHGAKLTKDSPIEYMPAPATVYVSVSQHIGAPALPVVNIGDKVKKGQLIAAQQGFVSANVYSSVSGTVKAINDIVNGLGQKQKHIIIENDFSDEEELFDDIKDLSPASIVERTALAGIVGLGGAGFPTAVKLAPKNPLDVLVINGAECEPYLTCDFRLMTEKTEEIYKGIKLTAKALNVNDIVIGIESNKPEAIEAFAKYDDVKVVALKKQYPMGSEKHLIYVTTGRKVPVGKMPFDVGACVQNIKTVLAIYEAVFLNKPLTETVITVSGKGIKEGKNLRVAIGTPFSEIIEYCGGKSSDTVKIVAGGPMMGKSLSHLDQYVRKTDSGILCLTAKETSLAEPSPCINCGICAKNCPMRLMPMYIESFFLAGDYGNAEKYGAMNCIECGLCAYNCPAKRALVQSISSAKAKIREMHKNG
ncbi:MAG: electron transport complex subunit RsxC [Clostridia bacterium]|nr:electron transport complex subunit RsxC [Clostridia bacterium]